MGSFKVKLVAYFLVLSLLPLTAATLGFHAVVQRAGDAPGRRPARGRPTGCARRLSGRACDRMPSGPHRLARSRAVQARSSARTAPRFGARSARPRTCACVGRGVHRRPESRRRRPSAGSPSSAPADARRASSARSRSTRCSPPASAPAPGSPRSTGSSSSPPPGESSGGQGRCSARGSSRSGHAGPGREAPVPRARGQAAAVPHGSTLAVLAPQAEIDARRKRPRSAGCLGLLGSLLLIALVAYLVGRSIVGTHRAPRRRRERDRAGRAAASASRSSGRDEFAPLGRAFNEMASQLEARLEELGAERTRLREVTTRFGEALAATHDAGRSCSAPSSRPPSRRPARRAACSSGRSGEVVRDRRSRTRAASGSSCRCAAGPRSFGTLLLNGAGRSRRASARAAASLVGQAVVALENARLHRIVERQALVDGLTGLANRRHCDEHARGRARARRALRRPARARPRRPRRLQAGQRPLRPPGRRRRPARRSPRRCSRASATSTSPARWGGEEFAMILPGTDARGRRARRRAGAAALRTRLDPRARTASTIRVTASFGVAAYPDADDRRRARRGGRRGALRGQAGGQGPVVRRPEQPYARSALRARLETVPAAQRLQSRAVSTRTPSTEESMPVETPSMFAQVIQDHLELKRRNAELERDMPLDRYKTEDPFNNHPLFKTEEQARLEETMDGQDVAARVAALGWPGEDAVDAAAAGRVDDAGSGAAPATSTGATSPASPPALRARRRRCRRAAACAPAGAAPRARPRARPRPAPRAAPGGGGRAS